MPEATQGVIGDGGVRLAVRAFDPPAPDAPGLLLHHGLASSSRIWDLMLPHLTRRLQVVAFDARGHGRSSKPTTGYGFAHTVADALAVIRATGLVRPVVAGHSWGAMVALELGARHPDAVSGIVLVDGGVGRRSDRGTWAETKERLAPPRLAGTPLVEFRAMMPRFLPIEITPEVEAIVLSVMRVDRAGRIRPRLARANHFRILRAIWEQDPSAIWRRLEVPALAILSRPGNDAEDDERTWYEAKRRAAAELRRTAGDTARVTWMTGIHDLPLQRPTDLAAQIERFARQVVR